MQVTEQASDTLLCVGESIDLSVSASHELQDSISYLWQLINNSDTLSEDSTLTGLQVLKTEIVRLFVTNTCNDERRSFSYRINARRELVNNLTIMNMKTVWCTGDELSFTASGRGGIDTNYAYSWAINDLADTGSSFSISIDSLATKYPSQDSFTLKAILSDGCSVIEDTAVFGFNVFECCRAS
jgi:hypothetical protein